MSATVPLEQALAQAREIKALTAEVKRLRDDLQVADQIGDSFWTALKPRLPEMIYVSNPGRHFTELLDAAEADVKALAEALEESERLVSEIHDRVWAAHEINRAALDRDGVRRGSGEKTR